VSEIEEFVVATLEPSELLDLIVLGAFLRSDANTEREQVIFDQVCETMRSSSLTTPTSLHDLD
jgi:hypothetical protein